MVGFIFVVGFIFMSFRNVGSGCGSQAGRCKNVLCLHGGSDDIALGKRRTATTSREKVAAKKRGGDFFKHDAGIPPVWDVWCVNVANSLASDIYQFVISEHAWWTICHIRNRYSATDRTMHRLRVGRSGKPLVHRTAFIGFVVTKTEPAQFLERDNPGDCFGGRG